MPSKITCVVVEDEAQILAAVCENLQSFPEIEIVGTAVGVDSAYNLICEKKPDAAFLDVSIQGGEIFNVIDRLEKNRCKIPISVILTGKPEYALEAWEYQKYVVNFLIKAESKDFKANFRAAIDAILSEKSKLQDSKTPRDRFFIEQRGQCFRVNCDEVFYIETGEVGTGTTKIICEKRVVPLGITLSKFLEDYPHPDFFRVSRNSAINTSKIEYVDKHDSTAIVIIDGKKVEVGVGKGYRDDLIQRLTL